MALRALISVCLLGVVLSLLVSCRGTSSNTASVGGEITIDGEPLPDDAIGSITFQTTKGGQGKTASAPIEGGTYQCPEVPLGALRVFITVQQPTGRTIDNSRGTPAQEYKNIISGQYASGIDVQIDGDRKDLDFDLRAS